MSVVYLFFVSGLIVVLSWPLGRYMKWVFDPERGAEQGRLHRLVDAAGGGSAAREQSWKRYLASMLTFNAGMFVVVFLVMSFQQLLPLNPDGKGPIEPSVIFNTTASFVSNTNLQHYSGEQTLSYLSQLALMWLQFVSAATGIAALAALARGLSGRTLPGNFFVDLSGATFLVLLPLALVMATVLVLLGTPMTFKGAAIVHTLEGATQTIARGPVAAFVAIKQLGTNGGGFFGPNSAHPFENPNFYTNIVSNVAILLIPMASVWMVGRITRRMRHAAVIFGVMTVLFVALASVAVVAEHAPTEALRGLPVANGQVNLEGKELRFGPYAGPLWAVSTTATSNGSVDAMHDSLNPLAGLMPMIGMWLNLIFGGVGVGYINMFIYIIIAVFIAGLMVGRTPEYLGRKVETREMKLALIALIVHPLFILGGTALFAGTPLGAGTTNNPGSHGFSEMLYEFSSSAANNGSGFEGLHDTVPWNIATGIVMLLARFIPIILPLAIAGYLGAKKPAPRTSGTLNTDGMVFAGMLLASIVVIGALLFMPVAVLGPISEHLQFMH